MSERDIYWKQSKIFDPTKDKQPEIYIYGAGSIGSWTTLCLTKVGFKNIHIIDFDILEIDNLPAQFYSTQMSQASGVAPHKVHQLQDLIKYMTEQEIEAINTKITKDSEIDIQIGSIHILAFDNMEARKIIYNKIKGMPVYLIDGRIGGSSWTLYTTNMRNKEDHENYQKTLEGTFSEEECGNKTSCPINMIIAAKITAETMKISTNKNISRFQSGNIWELTEIGDVNRNIPLKLLGVNTNIEYPESEYTNTEYYSTEEESEEEEDEKEEE